MKTLIILIMQIFVSACATDVKVVKIKPEFYYESCEDFKPLTETNGDSLVYQLRNNRLSHTDCYIKLESLIKQIEKFEDSNEEKKDK